MTATATAADLAVRGITKSYMTAAGTLDVLRGADLSLSRGDAVSIMGPSGSGKSTFLYILGTLETPTTGEVQLLGENPLQFGRNEVAKFRNERVGFIFQDHCLLPQCTVLENVLIPILATRGVDAELSMRAERLLDRVGLLSRLTHRPAELSGGEKQRVAICRALINAPPLLLADEPTGNLDHNTAKTVGSLLLEIAREQTAMLVAVTHSSELASRFPKQLELKNGKLETRRGSD